MTSKRGKEEEGEEEEKEREKEREKEMVEGNLNLHFFPSSSFLWIGWLVVCVCAIFLVLLFHFVALA